MDAKPIAFRALLRAVEPYINSVNMIRGSIDAIVSVDNSVCLIENFYPGKSLWNLTFEYITMILDFIIVKVNYSVNECTSHYNILVCAASVEPGRSWQAVTVSAIALHICSLQGPTT